MNTGKKLTSNQTRRFHFWVKRYYRLWGRDLPWRQTRDPYAICVSEIMLQQTQVDRVLPYYETWLKRYSNWQTLADSNLAEVLKLWLGLGYNRRAKRLWELARIVVHDGDGELPSPLEELESLPGIGPYTARAIRVFAFNLPEIMLETNVRSVYLYHFFPGETGVRDCQIAGLIETTLDWDEPRDWYNALMDYGFFIKRLIGNPNRVGFGYAKQTPFAGSARQLRGKVLKLIMKHNHLSLGDMQTLLEDERTETILLQLLAEGLVELTHRGYQLPHSKITKDEEIELMP